MTWELAYIVLSFTLKNELILAAAGDVNESST